jgi:hypothetical protein
MSLRDRAAYGIDAVEDNWNHLQREAQYYPYLQPRLEAMQKQYLEDPTLHRLSGGIPNPEEVGDLLHSHTAEVQRIKTIPVPDSDAFMRRLHTGNAQDWPKEIPVTTAKDKMPVPPRPGDYVHFVDAKSREPVLLARVLPGKSEQAKRYPGTPLGVDQDDTHYHFRLQPQYGDDPKKVKENQYETEQQAEHYAQPELTPVTPLSPVAPVATPFHSRLQRSLERLPAHPIQAQSVKNLVKKFGVPDEEWHATKMDAALAGKKAVHRDELLQHFHANKVMPQEVWKADSKAIRGRAMHLHDKRSMLPDEFSPEEASELQHLRGLIEQGYTAPKYNEYQTPGGENYRELLLTVPERDKITRKPVQSPAGWGDTEGGNVGFVEHGNTGADFRGSHWDEPNVIVHVRMNDRKGPNGEKVLHVEEVQSDLHQSGREQGYRGQVQQLPPDVFVRETGGDNWEAIDTRIGRRGERIAIAGSKDEAAAKALQALNEKGVPDLPYKESWPTLALKRVLHHAAQGGYDRLTLNNGEQVKKLVGGEEHGQNVFYDQTLPNVLAKLGKPFGVRPEKHSIGDDVNSREVEKWKRQHDHVVNLMAKVLNGRTWSELSKPEYDELMELDQEADHYEHNMNAARRGGQVSTTSIRITPEMRKAILAEGFPHMEEGGVAPGGKTVLQPGEVVHPTQGKPWKVPLVPGSRADRDSVIASLRRGDVVEPVHSYAAEMYAASARRSAKIVLPEPATEVSPETQMPAPPASDRPPAMGILEPETTKSVTVRKVPIVAPSKNIPAHVLAKFGSHGGHAVEMHKSYLESQKPKEPPQSYAAELYQSALRRDIAAANAETHTSPTDAQREAGNYRKGKVRLHGLTISIEVPRDGVRSGKSKDGKEWSIQLPHAYGYILGTQGKDKDHIDVFLGRHPESEIVFVVDQETPGGRFDEVKVMLGFRNEAEARKGYLSCYAPGWTGLGAITPMTVAAFKKWLDKGDKTQRVAPQAKSLYASEMLASWKAQRPVCYAEEMYAKATSLYPPPPGKHDWTKNPLSGSESENHPLLSHMHKKQGVGIRDNRQDYAEDQQGHWHGDAGKFAAKGSGGSAVPDAPAQATGAAPGSTTDARHKALVNHLTGVGSKLLSGAMAVEHGAKAGIQAAVSSLPKPLQALAAGAYHLCFGTYTSAQSAVQAVAKERGIAPEHIDKVSRALAVADVVGGGKLFPAALAASGLGALATVGSFVPIGSMAYLAFSTARNPAASLRAARKALTTLRKPPQSYGADYGFDLLGELARRVRELADHFDTWLACFVTAADENGDLQQSLQDADQALPEAIAAEDDSDLFEGEEGADMYQREDYADDKPTDAGNPADSPSPHVRTLATHHQHLARAFNSGIDRLHRAVRAGHLHPDQATEQANAHVQEMHEAVNSYLSRAWRDIKKQTLAEHGETPATKALLATAKDNLKRAREHLHDTLAERALHPSQDTSREDRAGGRTDVEGALEMLAKEPESARKFVSEWITGQKRHLEMQDAMRLATRLNRKLQAGVPLSTKDKQAMEEAGQRYWKPALHDSGVMGVVNPDHEQRGEIMLPAEDGWQVHHRGGEGWRPGFQQEYAFDTDANQYGLFDNSQNEAYEQAFDTLAQRKHQQDEEDPIPFGREASEHYIASRLPPGSVPGGSLPPPAPVRGGFRIGHHDLTGGAFKGIMPDAPATLEPHDSSNLKQHEPNPSITPLPNPGQQPVRTFPTNTPPEEAAKVPGLQQKLDDVDKARRAYDVAARHVQPSHAINVAHALLSHQGPYDPIAKNAGDYSFKDDPRETVNTAKRWLVEHREDSDFTDDFLEELDRAGDSPGRILKALYHSLPSSVFQSLFQRHTPYNIWNRDMHRILSRGDKEAHALRGAAPHLTPEQIEGAVRSRPGWKQPEDRYGRFAAEMYSNWQLATGRTTYAERMWRQEYAGAR